MTRTAPPSEAELIELENLFNQLILHEIPAVLKAILKCRKCRKCDLCWRHRERLDDDPIQSDERIAETFRRLIEFAREHQK